MNKNKNFNLDPNFIVGFIDGEGSFQFVIRKNKNSKIG